MYYLRLIVTFLWLLAIDTSAAVDPLDLNAIVETTTLDERAGPGFKCPKSLKRDGCLTQADMESILSRWPQTFDVKYSGDKLKELIDCTVSQDFTAYDKTFTFGGGGSGELTNGRKQFIQQQQQAYTYRKYSATAPGGAFSKIFAFHSCDMIAFRFQFKGKTSGKTKCTSTANTQAGNPIHYYGTDLLTIQKGSLLVERVITSADWINNFLPIGADFNGSSICPGTVPPACDPDCGPCSSTMQRFGHR